jgi:hypothetical protein
VQKSEMIDKQKSRRIRAEIRRALLDHWDPIGIKDEPHAQDEYDAYLGGIYDLLVGGASDQELSDHLWKIIEERISIHPQAGATARTVQALRNIML